MLWWLLPRPRELLKEIIARMDDLDAAGIKTGNDVDGKGFYRAFYRLRWR